MTDCWFTGFNLVLFGGLGLLILVALRIVWLAVVLFLVFVGCLLVICACILVVDVVICVCFYGLRVCG